jgi:general secretion pathway protein G
MGAFGKGGGRLDCQQTKRVDDVKIDASGASIRPADPRTTLLDSRARGFTLIEVLIVVAIIATLTAIAVPAYFEALEKAKISVCLSDIRSIESMVLTFASDTGDFPDSLDEVGAAHLRDPWGSHYRYLRIEGGSAPPGKLRKDHFVVPVNSDFDLYSMGPDRASRPPFTAKASRDDIVRTSNGGYVGPVSGY